MCSFGLLENRQHANPRGSREPTRITRITRNQSAEGSFEHRSEQKEARRLSRAAPFANASHAANVSERLRRRVARAASASRGRKRGVGGGDESDRISASRRA